MAKECEDYVSFFFFFILQTLDRRRPCGSGEIYPCIDVNETSYLSPFPGIVLVGSKKLRIFSSFLLHTLCWERGSLSEEGVIFASKGTYKSQRVPVIRDRGGLSS